MAETHPLQGKKCILRGGITSTEKNSGGESSGEALVAFMANL